MIDLTAREQAFVTMMAESTELAERGFQMLLKRPHPDRFLNALRDKGLFAPDRNPPPEPAGEEGYYRVPHWGALDYLKTLAHLSSENDNGALADAVMDLVRAVSTYRDSHGTRRDNFRTAQRLAEIIGLVPLSCVTLDDLDLLVPLWLDSQFDRGRLVGHALDEGFLARALASDHSSAKTKAVAVLRHCTAIRWEEDTSISKCLSPRMAAADYAIEALIQRHAAAFGHQAGELAAPVLLDRVRELFSVEHRGGRSSDYRPAIEDHEQNHRWRAVENVAVVALRDVLVHWCDSAPNEARTFITSLLTDDSEIVRRVGLHLLDQRWSLLKAIFVAHVGPALFDWGHLHELYHLLEGHFAQLAPTEQTALVTAIRQIPASGPEEEQVTQLRETQRRWLSAIAGKGNSESDAWWRELSNDTRLRPLSEHPQFDLYMESASGPGPSPYHADELLALARDGSLVERLSAFQKVDYWQGPSERALVEALENAVKTAPSLFLDSLPMFHNATRRDQYGVINGFKDLWEASRTTPAPVEWTTAWPRIFDFLEHLFSHEAFWSEDVERPRDFTPTRDWIPPVVADLLMAGTRNDVHAYPADLMPRGWTLVRCLLANTEAVDSPSETDPMTQAINSSRGKALEALFLHALRACRLADSAYGNHVDAWADLRPIFDAELAQSSGGNYEFSTLCGAYLANLEYLSPQWLTENVKSIFSETASANYLCAISGLAYGAATKRLYVALRESGVVDRAVRTDLKARHAREKLMERIALAYLWGEEDLNSPRFTFLFDNGREPDLVQLTRYFWSAQREVTSPELRARILAFWRHVVTWAGVEPAPRPILMGSLATLSCYLESADGDNLELLLAVAPFVHQEHATHAFIQDLQRLLPASPAGVRQTLGRLLSAHVPSFDYENRLTSLLVSLAEYGPEYKVAAIHYAELARSLPGMEDVFKGSLT